MNIKLIYELVRDFFDLMYSPFIGEDIEEDIEEDNYDEEKGWNELEYYENNLYKENLLVEIMSSLRNKITNSIDDKKQD
jgi:hypothetical protein